MKPSLPYVLLAILLFHPGGLIFAAPLHRDWIILNFQYSAARPDDSIDPAGLTTLSTLPRIFSGLISQFTRVRMANGESLDLPASHPLRLASGEWRRPDRLKADDRIRYGGRIIRVTGIDSLKREPAVRVYVIEAKESKDDLRVSTGRLTEDPLDLLTGAPEAGFCSGKACQQRLGLLYTRPPAFAGGTAWFYSFIAIQDFSRAYKDLSSSSLRSRRKAIEWIQQHGTPEQNARLKLFAHNAGWRGMGLSSAEFYQNLVLLKTETFNDGTMTAFDREILRHDFGREVDRENPSDAGTSVAEEAEPEIRQGPIIDWPAIGRSAVLPGWGNVYLDRPNSGYAYGALFIGSASFAYSEYNRAIVFASAYKEKSLRADILALVLSKSLDRDAMLVQALYLNQDANNSLKAYRRSATGAINAAQIAGLVYAVSLFHVSTLAISWPDPEQPGSSARLLIQPAADQVQCSVVVGW